MSTKHKSRTSCPVSWLFRLLGYSERTQRAKPVSNVMVTFGTDVPQSKAHLYQ